MTIYAIPGPVDDMIMVQVGMTAAGVEGEPSGDLQGFKDDIPASCRKLKPLLLKRSFSPANSANPANPGSDKGEAQPNHRQLVLPCPMHDKPVKHNLAKFQQIHETDTSGNHDLRNSLNWVNSNSMIGSEDDVI